MTISGGTSLSVMVALSQWVFFYLRINFTPQPSSKDKRFYKSIFNALKYYFQVGVFRNVEHLKIESTVWFSKFRFSVAKQNVAQVSFSLPKYVCVTQFYAHSLLNADILLRQKAKETGELSIVNKYLQCWEGLPAFYLVFGPARLTSITKVAGKFLCIFLRKNLSKGS